MSPQHVSCSLKDSIRITWKKETRLNALQATITARAGHHLTLTYALSDRLPCHFWIDSGNLASDIEKVICRIKTILPGQRRTAAFIRRIPGNFQP
jgi:xanthine dehydrogenase molybdopterin-binding subunit B